MSKKKSLRGVMEYNQYELPMTDEEREWAKQFYDEYHGGNSTKYDTPILKTKKQIKEANRNYNSLYMDAFSVSRMLNKQEEISADQREIYELASDENDWQIIFDRDGEEAAMDTIMDQAIRDLDSGQSKKVVLSRFYVKMNRLKKEVQKEKRRQR